MQTLHRSILILFAALAVSLTSCDVINGGVDQEEALAKLSGAWFRVGSNNRANDGLRLEVIGANGTITGNPRGGFDIGDVKWKGLVATEPDMYSYEELGSDGNYYPASLFFDGDTARISIQSGGAGNSQKWVKEDAYTEPIAQTVTLDCGSLPGTLTNTAAAIDYIVPSGCVLDVTEALVIEAGTTIEFEENSGIGVYDNGSLKAIGTSAQPITLKGRSDVQGYWRGIHIETNTLENQLDHVSISNAGSNYVYCCNTVASVFLKGGKLSIKSTEIRNGGAAGLYADGNADLHKFEDVSINSHVGYPMILDPERASQLDGEFSDFSGNDEDFVFITQNSIQIATNFPKLNIPYLIEGKVINVEEALTLEAGVEIAFEENGGIGVYDNGSLKIAGTNAENVILRGKEAVKGYWRGIHTETNSTSNQIDYAVISDAGGDYVYCCNTAGSLFLKDGKMAIRNTTISNGKSYGIVTQKDFTFEAFENNTITTHDENPLYVAAKQAGKLDGMNSDYTGNNKDFILFYRATSDETTTLPRNNVPYRVENNVVLDVTAPLTLEAGVDLVFEQNAGLGVYDNGTLAALGTAGLPINFRGAENIKGYWRGIHTETTSSNNVLDNVNLKNAGSNYVFCCNPFAALYVRSGTMELKNSNISDNDGCGVFVRSSATLTESSNTFSNNTNGNICN